MNIIMFRPLDHHPQLQFQMTFHDLLFIINTCYRLKWHNENKSEVVGDA